MTVGLKSKQTQQFFCYLTSGGHLGGYNVFLLGILDFKIYF
jgi:hypothetical protein